MGVFHIQVRVVRGEDDIVFQAEFRQVPCGDLIAFYGSVALALEIPDRFELETGIFYPARGLHVFSHAP